MLVILDRDGVINQESPDYIKSPQEWVPIPGSLEKIAELTKKGYQIVVVTNQSGIGRRLFDEKTLHTIHSKFRQKLAALGGKVDGIFYCPHLPESGCNCRKPKPGLLLEVAEKYNVDLKMACFVGDSLGDIQAAKAVGCKPILVKTGRGLETMRALGDLEGIWVFDDLSSINFEVILKNSRKTSKNQVS